MTSRKFKNSIILIAFAMYVVYYRFFLFESKNIIIDYINVATISVMAFISILLLGFRKDKMSKMKKSILGMTISEIIIFFAVSYGLGTITGYDSNSYSLTIPSIIENIFAPVFYVVAIEVFRYSFSNANKDKGLALVLLTTLITMLELSIGLKGVSMYDFQTYFTATASIILPIVIKNATLSYLTINGGLKPVLFYRLIMDTYKYYMPIFPVLGEYIESVIGILLPTLIYMYSARMVDNREQVEDAEYSKKSLKITDIPMIIFIVVLVALISGKFKYSLIGVGSESMQPKIAKGDGIVFERVEKEEDFKVGDVLVFQSGSKMIIHRLVDIKKDSKSTYYVTKGDANNAPDSIHLTLDNIKGKVLFKIKYIAYPNLWLKDMVDKG